MHPEEEVHIIGRLGLVDHGHNNLRELWQRAISLALLILLSLQQSIEHIILLALYIIGHRAYNDLSVNRCLRIVTLEKIVSCIDEILFQKDLQALRGKFM